MCVYSSSNCIKQLYKLYYLRFLSTYYTRRRMLCVQCTHNYCIRERSSTAFQVKCEKKTLRYSPRILCRVVTLQLKHCKNIYNRGIFLYKRTRKRVRNRRDNIDYDLQRRLIIHKPRTTSVVSHVRHWESRYVRERQT